MGSHLLLPVIPPRYRRRCLLGTGTRPVSEGYSGLSKLYKALTRFEGAERHYAFWLLRFRRSRSAERIQRDTIRGSLRLLVRPRMWDRSLTATADGPSANASRTVSPTRAASPRPRRACAAGTRRRFCQGPKP